MTIRARLLAIEETAGRTLPRDSEAIALTEAAAGAAGVACIEQPNGPNLTDKQEAAIAALLTEPTYARAAAAAGVSEGTLYRWLHLPAFRTAFRQARRELVEAGVGRLQAATAHAVEALVAVARHGRRDGDRVRAANALLEHAFRGLTDADRIHGTPAAEPAPSGTADVVAILAARLRQIDQAELPAADKARLTAVLADSLLRAIGVDVIDKRLEAMHAILAGRQETTP
jgi:hypothetical protein